MSVPPEYSKEEVLDQTKVDNPRRVTLAKLREMISDPDTFYPTFKEEMDERTGEKRVGEMILQYPKIIRITYQKIKNNYLSKEFKKKLAERYSKETGKSFEFRTEECDFVLHLNEEMMVEVPEI